MLEISRKVQDIPSALSVYFNQLIYDLKRRQRDIISLSLGESFFNIPPFDFGKLDFNKGYHYSDSQGLPELREKIAKFYHETYKAPAITSNDILISAGSKIIIFMCMQALLNPGDEVLIHEPAWLSYQEQARLVGGEVRFIPFLEKTSDFQKYFTSKTRILILNNPNNPSGVVYSEHELRALYHECYKHGVCLFVDEAYSDFVLDDSFCSMTTVAPDLKGIIVVNSLSKNMGMSGWRVGYAISEPRIIQALLKLNQHLITCAPTILQQYLVEYFDDILAHTLVQVKEVVAKRKRIETQMKNTGLDYLPGSSTFYFFVKTGAYQGSIHDLALYLLLEKGVALVPGSAYGATTDKFLRLSIGTESEERIENGLRILKNVLSGPPIDSAYIHAELARLKLPVFQENMIPQAEALLDEVLV
ncbi:MAG: pyridoxal phosphate-dependent aminotransferase [Legionella sp.]|nr:pyridoxal phosphate-dependent aminotransferase [Legionella sp.]